MTAQIIPATLFLELLAGVGAALFLANLAVLLRHRFAKDPSKLPPRPPLRRIVPNLIIGGVIMLWAGITLLVQLGIGPGD